MPADEEDHKNIKETYDKNGNMVQREWTKEDGTKVLIKYKDGDRSYRQDKYTDGTSSEFSEYGSNERSTKRVNKDKNGNITSIYRFEYNKDGSYKSQRVDANDQPIGEPIYYDANDKKITKEEFEKRKQ